MYIMVQLSTSIPARWLLENGNCQHLCGEVDEGDARARTLTVLQAPHPTNGSRHMYWGALKVYLQSMSEGTVEFFYFQNRLGAMSHFKMILNRKLCVGRRQEQNSYKISHQINVISNILKTDQYIFMVRKCKYFSF